MRTWHISQGQWKAFIAIENDQVLDSEAYVLSMIVTVIEGESCRGDKLTIEINCMNLKSSLDCRMSTRYNVLSVQRVQMEIT